MATKYVVTDLGPIDRREPGTDVTDVYTGALLKRLIAEGYVAEAKPKPTKTTKSKPAKSSKGRVSDGD